MKTRTSIFLLIFLNYFSFLIYGQITIRCDRNWKHRITHLQNNQYKLEICKRIPVGQYVYAYHCTSNYGDTANCLKFTLTNNHFRILSIDDLSYIRNIYYGFLNTNYFVYEYEIKFVITFEKIGINSGQEFELIIFYTECTEFIDTGCNRKEYHIIGRNL